MTARTAWIVALASLIVGASEAEANAQGASTKPRGGQKDDATAKPPTESFSVTRSTWARFSERRIAEKHVEPSESELAARFGLENLGPRAADGIVEYRQASLGMRFVFVPGGTFRMGSNHGDIFASPIVVDSAIRGKADETYFGNEQPQLEVYVSPYFIGVYEVTNAEYGSFLSEWRAGRVSESCEWPLLLGKPDHTPYLAGDPRRASFDGDRKPVVGISWVDAYAFCAWVGGRLATEAEWEKAARGTDGRIFPWGNRFDPMRANVSESQNFGMVDVGTYPGGRSPYGCYDMTGNAAEWCLDSFEESFLRAMPVSNPCLLERHPARDRRSQRGGASNRYGFLFKGRTSARGSSKLVPRFPDPTKETLDSFPITEYLFSGIRVVLSPLQDLFADGDVDRLRASSIAIGKARMEAIKRKQESGGAGRAAPAIPQLPGTVPATTPDDDGGQADGGNR